MFFFLSGFLIWSSVGRERFPVYLKKRALRIYPELWAAVAASLLSIMLLFREQIPWPQLVLFGLTQGTVMQFWMPDFLRSFGCGTPNGALWTISLTLQFYLLAWPLYRFLLRRSFWLLLAVTAACFALGWVSPRLESVLPVAVWKVYKRTVIPYLWCFLLGGLCAAYFDRVIPVLRRIWPLLLGLLGIWTLLVKMDLMLGQYPLLGSLLFCTGSLGFAYTLPQINLKTDISYGVYIYHMIIVNIFIEIGFVRSGWSMLAVYALSFVVATASALTLGRIGKGWKLMGSAEGRENIE